MRTVAIFFKEFGNNLDKVSDKEEILAINWLEVRNGQWNLYYIVAQNTSRTWKGKQFFSENKF